jgi:hypothetical protein
MDRGHVYPRYRARVGKPRARAVHWDRGLRQFDSRVLDPGDIFVVTVEGSGKLTYHCALHPEMKGSVTVGEGVDGGEVNTTEEANPALDEPTGEAPPAEGESTEEAPPAEETTSQEEAV